MLDPQYLGHVADGLEELFAELETSIVSDIARRIKENKYEVTSTAQHQANRLKALDMQYDDVQKRISEILDISEKEVKSIITEASFGSVDKDNVIFQEAYQRGLIHNFNYNVGGLKKLIVEGIEATNSEIRNICKTTAKASQRSFTKALDQVCLSVQSGAFSVDEAIKSAVTELSEKGIQWVDYNSGTHRRVDSAIRNAVRTGVNQTSCKCQDKNFEEMGGNLVETSSHMGARPDHAMWQGMIFWRKQKYKNYRNFEQATGYGTGAGLGGWGCRHSYWPYFEGLSSKSFEHYRLSENEEHYELEQEQRYNERMIREWRRRSSVNYSGGVDNTKEARKVREWTQRQSDFLKEHPELKRNYARESIVNSKVGGLNAKNKYYDSIQSTKPEIIGKLSKQDSITKNKVLEAYEKQICNLDYETAIVIQKNGLINRVKGTTSTVDIEQLDELNGSFVTHNHPIGLTNYSFSGSDIQMFLQYHIQELHGVDEKYIYTIKKNSDTIYKGIDNIKNDFGNKYRLNAIENNLFEALDDDEYHEIVKIISKKFRFTYERVER